VRAAIKQREVDERIELGDEEVLEIISKQLKEKKMAIEEFRRGNRQDLVDLTEAEMSILLEYLPKQLSEEEVEQIVRETIDEIGATSLKEIGIIMKTVMPKVKGRADGNMINQAVRKILN
ncbi:MAG TPA: GatB/YqeY domain-containing protein, partial [Gudongella oleilytica]|nr:GatB/YqeY domain-containing protein [Gudongella oleilytica]